MIDVQGIYRVSTYEPGPERNWAWGWVLHKDGLSARAVMKEVHVLEARGYDRHISILVQRNTATCDVIMAIKRRKEEQNGLGLANLTKGESDVEA